MITNGFLTADESQNLVVTVGTIFDNFGGTYTNSRKEPDFCTYPNTLRFPTIVIESGWSESRPTLEQDADLWLKGGQGRLELAIILKWTKITAQEVKGDVTVYDLDAGGNVRKLQNEQVFPAPPNSAGQTIPITRGQLYGSAPVPAGRSGTDVWQFSIDRLRIAARSAIESEGYIPANREKPP
ncbi:hypothetical protein FQN50_008662 [Emmonsiellopsis sp. PD_5]|nr:hypothetical protein FQN50_008662 [Emmonsiellopsis sp. PD_5]